MAGELLFMAGMGPLVPFVLLHILTGVSGQENAVRWSCDSSTKYPDCNDKKSQHLCTTNNNTGEYVPCYNKCHNVKDRPFDLIDCEKFCKGYLEEYCRIAPSSTTQSPVSLGTTRITAWNTTSAAGTSVLATTTTSNYYLIVPFLILLVVVFVIVGVVVKRRVSNQLPAALPEDNAQGTDPGNAAANTSRPNAQGCDAAHVAVNISGDNAQGLVVAPSSATPEDEDFQAIDNDIPHLEESENQKFL